VATNHAGYTGDGFIDMVGEGPLEFAFNSSAGRYELSVRYALAHGERPLDVYVDGELISSLNFTATGAWNSWGNADLSLELSEGEHMISLQPTGSSGANIDGIGLVLSDEVNLDDTPTTDPESFPDSLPDSQPEPPPVIADEPLEPIDSLPEPEPIIKPERSSVRVEAEDYTAFFDNSAGNSGGLYRLDDVDIENTSDEGGGFNVGWMRAGEWLEYQADLQPGPYQVTARVASPYETGSLELSADGPALLSTEVASTGGWQAWQDLELGELELSDLGGEESFETLRVAVTGDRFNLNWLEFTRVDTLADDTANDTGSETSLALDSNLSASDAAGDAALASAMASFSAPEGGDMISVDDSQNLLASQLAVAV
jgi:hypothetical protein